jgi:hypothetical protein
MLRFGMKAKEIYMHTGLSYWRDGITPQEILPVVIEDSMLQSLQWIPLLEEIWAVLHPMSAAAGPSTEPFDRMISLFQALARLEKKYGTNQ